MATLETLLDVETEIERVFGVYLGTTLGLQANKSDSDAALTVPRIDIVAIVQQMGPHVFTIPSGTYAGRNIFDQFMISLSLDLIFSPFGQANIATTPTASAYRGSLRRCLSDWDGVQAAFESGGLLHIAKGSIRQMSGNRSINDADKVETITTTLAAQVFINQAVIPT